MSRAEVELVMANAREQIISNGAEPTVGELVLLVARTRPDLPEVAINRVAAEVLASQPGSSGDQARELIHQEVARRLRINPLVKEAMEEAFAVVLGEFRDVTLKNSAVLESVGRQVHGVTGGQMREFAKRLREAAPRPLTEEQILAWADAYYARTRDWPRKDSGDVQDAAEETWADVDRALRRNLRGLQCSSSLAQLLAEKRGVRNRADLAPLDEEQILSWADMYKEAKGDWPNSESGKVTGTDESWLGIDASLRAGRRSLPGGSSLAKLLAERRGVRNHSPLPEGTRVEIHLMADESPNANPLLHFHGHVDPNDPLVQEYVEEAARRRREDYEQAAREDAQERSNSSSTPTI
jgi:hypothetical protein